MTRPKKLDAAVLGSILGLAFTVALTMVFVGQLIMILDIDVRHGHNRTQIVADIILFSAPVLLGLTGITVMICFLMKSIRECRQDSS